MLGWLMILVSGLLGSAHCVGMCGGFVLAIGAGASNGASNLIRQLVYGCGRVFTYGVLGVAAGTGGAALQRRLQSLANVQSLLSIAAGVLLVVLGLGAAGLFRALRVRLSTVARQPPVSVCLASSLFSAFLRRPGLPHVFLAGLLNGLLPCGLVYAFLALAASSGDLVTGAAVMTLFGLGTLPALTLAGCTGQLISLAARRHVVQIAAWCVVLTGVLTVIRGFGFAAWPGILESPGCPWCH